MDKRKGIILAVVLFLLIGLGTFVFADEPNDDPGKNTGETNGPSDTNNDGSTTNPDEESEVQDEENSGTDDERVTATNRRPSNSGSTEVIIGGGTGGETPSTDNPSSDNGSNAGEGEENPGEVTEDPDTTAPVITINGESYQGKGNNIGYVNGDVILSLAEKNLEVVVTKDGEELSFENGMTLSLDGKYVITVTDEAENKTVVEFSIDNSAPVVTGIEDGDITNTIGSITVADDNEVTILLNGNEVALEDIASLAEEGENILIVKDSLDNQTSITFTYDTTPIQAEWLYTLNSTYHNTNLVDKHYQVIGDGQKLYVELVFAEEFESVPTIAVGASEAVNMSCEWTNWETERQYYKCDATITIDGASQSLVNNAELPILITNIVDAAGNPTRLDNTNITDNGTYGEVIYDKEAPVYESLGVLNVTHLRENNNGASGDLTVVNVGDEIRVLLRFNEILEVNPTITIGGFEYKLELKTDYQNFAEYTYLVDIKITEEMKLDNGKIDFEISGYADAAGNGGEKLTAEDINHTKFTGVELDTIDPGSNDDATGANWVYILNLSDANNRQTIGNGQTLRVEVKIDEELVSIPKLEIGNTQSVDFKSCTQQSYGYICVADIKIDNSIAHLVHGEDIPFKITNIIDAAGNETVLDNDDVTYTTNYGQVKFDGEAPEIVSLLFNSANKIDYHYANENHNIGIYLIVNEKLRANPTFKLNGQECATDYQTEEVSSGYKYAVLCKLPEDAEQGEVEFEITNVTDIVGNTITEPITNEAITDTDKTYVVFDSVDPDIEMQTHGEGQSYKNWNTVTVEIIEENLHEVYYKWGNTSSYTPVDLDEIKKTEDGKYQLTVPVSKDGRVRLYVKVVDKVGHEKEERGYFNIDTTVPTATVEYSTTDWTNDNVVATIKPSEAVTITNNGGSDTYTFTENGEFTFKFVDKAQNVGSVTATVNNIDKEAKGVTFSSNGGSRVDNKFDVEVTVLEENVEEVVYLFTTSGNSENIKKYGFNQSGVKVEELVDGKFVATLEGKSSGKYTLWVKVTDKAGNVSYTKTSNKFSLDSEVEVVLFKTNSNNANDQSLAKAGDWIGVYLQVGEELLQKPTFTINGEVVTATYLGEFDGVYAYQAGITVTEEMSGKIEFTISDIIDKSNNKLTLSSEECEYSVTIDNGDPTIVLAGTEGLNHNEFRIEAGTKISIDDILATVEDNVDEDTKIEPYDVTLFPVNGENVYHYDFKQNGFNTRLTGRYNLYYKTTDKAGNSAEAVMLLVINDTTPATLTFSREDGYTVDVGSNYEELGATVTDNVDETIVIMPRIYVKYDLAMNPLHETVSKIDTNEEGRYLAIFDYTDSSNNVSLTLKRWIVVRDISE